MDAPCRWPIRENAVSGAPGPAQKAANAYGVEAIPQLLVIDKNGTVTWGQAGYMPGMEFTLARELGIRNYTPALPQPNYAAGAPDGNAGH
jgi:hypothetical protein